MLEAKLSEAATLKRLLDAIKELVADANFECNEEGIELQAMDNSHVALVAVKLMADGFRRYRCDRPMPLGVNLNSLTKVLKCAKDDDQVILRANDDADVLNLTYEARSTCLILSFGRATALIVARRVDTDRIAEYALKLMDIDSDQLGIPDTDYDARVTMPSAEFTRIVRDLSQLGESVRIEVSKEGVRFASEGEAANGSVLLKHTEPVSSAGSSSKKAKKVKKEEGVDDEDDEPEEKEKDEDNEDGDDDEEEEGSGKGKAKVKKEKIKKEKVKKEAKDSEDGDVDMEDNEDEDEKEFKAEDGEDEQDDEDEEGASKKRKRPSKTNGPSKRRKGRKDDDDDDDNAPPADADAVRIELNAHVSLTFSLKYLVNFAKSASLSNVVQLMMSNDVPLLVSYEFGQGYIRYYLAPKIGDD
ncbi:hypothetical protein EIP86_006470 [Pleurotus ostreatoroseus]|nr:hypothetical protein EIP86_006470 [Pleurotus ostreatoroseus]